MRIIDSILIATLAATLFGIGFLWGKGSLIKSGPQNLEVYQSPNGVYTLNAVQSLDTITVYQDFDILYFIPTKVEGYDYAFMTESCNYTVLLTKEEANNFLYWTMTYPIEEGQEGIAAAIHYTELFIEKILE
jgi:hypothetical protein